MSGRRDRKNDWNDIDTAFSIVILAAMAVATIGHLLSFW
jgi:hypothetical protein